MKQNIIVVALLMSVALAAVAETNLPVMKQGNLISRHLPDLAAFGDGKPLLASPAGIPGTTEVMMWRIGEGILTVATSIGAGVIKEMSYILRTDGGRGLSLVVKEFNPKTGEMTIRVPNNTSDGIRQPADGLPKTGEQTPDSDVSLMVGVSPEGRLIQQVVRAYKTTDLKEYAFVVRAGATLKIIETADGASRVHFLTDAMTPDYKTTIPQKLAIGWIPSTAIVQVAKRTGDAQPPAGADGIPPAQP